MKVTGRHFDDLEMGEQFTARSRTVTETDLVMFAAMSGDLDHLHTSEEFAKDTQFGTRIAHGLLGLNMAHGLMWARTGMLVQTGLKDIMIKRRPGAGSNSTREG